MLRFFDEAFDENIFFCFTNSQSTFFSPGDTSPVLNKFIREFQRRTLILNKQNTFCFDSESFRYLVASEHSIQFEEKFVEQFEQSWIRSVQESNRLVKQISSKEIHKYIEHKWISILSIKQQINHLIRPILEALRNLSTNTILTENESFERSIQLISTSLPSPKLICYKLDRSYQTFDQIHIMSDRLHELSDQCEHEHLTTNYELHYQFLPKKPNWSSEDANADLYAIIKACAHFDYFFNDDGRTKRDGPFLAGINRMIDEEKYISQRENSPHFNEKLYRRLEKTKDQYYKDLDKIHSTDEHSFLKSLSSRIEGMKQIPMIYVQLNPNPSEQF